MKKGDTNKAWHEMDDDEERMEIRTEETKVVRERPTQDKDGKPAVQKETYLTRKTFIPVRRVVKERRNWAKFGEVADVPRGEHKLGDFGRENEVTIFSSGDDQTETGIVTILNNLTTEKMREKQLEARKKDMERSEDFGDKQEVVKDKYVSAFGAAANTNTDYAIKVWDIYPEEREFRKVEEELKEFFDTIWAKQDIRCIRSKFLSNKTTQEFIGKAYFTFTDDKSAAKALAALDRVIYNSVSISAEWARDDVKKPVNNNNVNAGNRRR